MLSIICCTIIHFGRGMIDAILLHFRKTALFWSGTIVFQCVIKTLAYLFRRAFFSTLKVKTLENFSIRRVYT